MYFKNTRKTFRKAAKKYLFLTEHSGHWEHVLLNNLNEEKKICFNVLPSLPLPFASRSYIGRFTTKTFFGFLYYNNTFLCLIHLMSHLILIKKGETIFPCVVKLIIQKNYTFSILCKKKLFSMQWKADSLFIFFLYTHLISTEKHRFCAFLAFQYKVQNFLMIFYCILYFTFCPFPN